MVINFGEVNFFNFLKKILAMKNCINFLMLHGINVGGIVSKVLKQLNL